MDGDDAGQALHQLINGYRISQAIHVAASLGIADHLADGSRTSGDLAAATATHPESLYRLLRALAAAGVLYEGDGCTFSLTAIGRCLRRGSPGSRHAWAAFSGRPSYWKAWSHLLQSVRTGDNAFRHAHGTDVWSYRAQHPAEGRIFDAAMREGSLRAFNDILPRCDFGRFARVADIGGGDGSFLAAVLRAHDRCRGLLFDQPHVVAAAGAALCDAGVAARCDVAAGDFFREIPAGFDAYVLKFILHDWLDEEALAILRVCRRACGRSGRLIVLERIGPANDGLEAKFSDLNMLVSAGGQERTLEEFQRLFHAAGFARASVVQGSGLHAVIEVAPADVVAS